MSIGPSDSFILKLVCVGCALGVRWVCLGQGVKDGQRLWLWVDLLWRSIPFEQAREPTTTRKTAASACAHCLRRLVAHAVCCFMPLPIRAHLFCKATGKLLAHMIDHGYDRCKLWLRVKQFSASGIPRCPTKRRRMFNRIRQHQDEALAQLRSSEGNIRPATSAAGAGLIR